MLSTVALRVVVHHQDRSSLPSHVCKALALSLAFGPGESDAALLNRRSTRKLETAVVFVCVCVHLARDEERD
jgi:hypothetical protein